tara:strand:+ start:2007 stop:2477 length:471 start_codon:yes stop_codon:yes gene_type:complete
MTYTPEAPGTYQGNQVVLNSDRLLFNAKTDSILLFSDKAIGFSTRGSFHFDTSPFEESKFVVNSPKIYLGLEYDNSLPKQPAVLGHELKDFLSEVLDLIGEICDDICVNTSYTQVDKGTKTGINPDNFDVFQEHKDTIEELKEDMEDIMSINTKLV